MAGYLTRPSTPNLAPWQTRMQGPPLAAPDDVSTSPAMPDRAPRAIRAAVSAFVVLLAPPPDAGTRPIPSAAPDRAPAQVRGPRLAHAVSLAPPADAGTLPTPSYAPDRAAGPRYAAAAYRLTQPSPGDQGVVLGDMPADDTLPDMARVAARSAAASYLIALAPPRDAGDVPAPVELPDLARGARRAAWQPSSVPSPMDSGTLPTSAILPDRAQAPARAANQSYGLAEAPPPDAGDAAFPPEMPDRAQAASRAVPSLIVPPVPESAGFVGPGGGPRAGNRYRFRRGPEPGPYALVVASPPDAGVAVQDPAPAQSAPSRAPGQARAAGAAYAVAVPAPSDAGTLPTPAEWPDLARGPRYASAAYALIQPAPADQGIVPGAPPSVAPSAPDRASASSRAARLAYAVAVASPRDAGDVGFPAVVPDRAPQAARTARLAYAVTVPAPRDAGTRPIAPQGPDRAAAAPPRLANLQVWLRAPLDAGTQPTPISTPDRAQAARRAGWISPGTPSPVDPGIVLAILVPGQHVTIQADPPDVFGGQHTAIAITSDTFGGPHTTTQADTDTFGGPHTTVQL